MQGGREMLPVVGQTDGGSLGILLSQAQRRPRALREEHFAQGPRVSSGPEREDSGLWTPSRKPERTAFKVRDSLDSCQS